MKRKCGTCKYFEDRGVANSGICQHIQRRELRDVVLVRQSELACRNSWDQDLWEPHPNLVADAADLADVDTVVDDQPSDRWASDGALFAGDEQDHANDQQDRVTDIRVPVLRDAGVPHPSRETLARAGVVDHDHDDDSWVARPSLHAALKKREEARRQEIQRRQAAELEEISKQMESDEAVGPASSGSTLWSADAGANRFGRGSYTSDREVRRPGLVTSADAWREDFREPDAPSRLEGSVHLDLDGGPELSEETAPLPTDEVRSALERSAPSHPAPSPVIHIDGNVYGGQKQRHAPAPVHRAPLPMVADPESADPVDRDARLQAIRRCCGTCRDFRAVGDGTRGQCVNPYAFGEPRMVQSDQLACRSSLGMWWMPNDETWLERADTSHHGRPTPLLDGTMPVKAGDGGRGSRHW